MKMMMTVAAVLAAVGMVAGCFTSATAYTETTHADGSVTVSKVRVIGTGDKASEIAAEGLFADGTQEDLGAGVKTASASQTSTGIDGTLAAAGNLFAQGVQAGMAAYGMRAAPADGVAEAAARPAGETRDPPVSAPLSAVSGDGYGFVAVLGNRATCSLCRSLWAGLDAAALSERLCGAGVIDADATANASEYAKYKPDGPFAYPLIRVFGADGKLAGEFSGRGLTQADIAARVNTLIGCK